MICISQGWHCCSEALPLPQEASSSPKEKYAPYLTRIMGLAKYSKKLLIQCMSTEAGLDYLRWLDEVKTNSQIYKYFLHILPLLTFDPPADWLKVLVGEHFLNIPFHKIVKSLLEFHFVQLLCYHLQVLF